jgi:predicted Zn-dependent peptidase
VTIHISHLPSGLTVATEHVPGARSVATGVWVCVGARDEPAPLSGVSHFLEHLLFKGTEEMSARQISEAVDRVGGDMNAFTTKEYTAYYTRLPAGCFDLGAQLLGDVLTRPALRAGDVESERKVILEELAMDDDSPDDVAHRALMRLLFPDHPLGRETAGERASVLALGPDEVRRFHAERYGAGSMVVAVAGPVEHEQVLETMTRCFEQAPHGGATPDRDVPPTSSGGFELIEDDTEQVHLTLGFRALDRFDPDREALDVMNHVLGGGMSSRLFEEIREKRGLVYSVYSGAALYADAGALTIYAGMQPDHAGEVASLIRSELTGLRKDGITDDELDIARGYLTGAFVMGLEDTGSRMARLGGLLATTGEVTPVAEQVARWNAVSHDDVHRVIERLLDQPMAIAAVGPITDDLAAAFEE